MPLSAQNLTRGERVDPALLYRVTFWTDIPCPASITDAARAQRCIHARAAHERVAKNLAEKQLKADGFFVVPQIARMEGEPQLLGLVGGTRMVSKVIGHPTRAWSFDELRGQVAFLGGRHVEQLRLETSDTTGSAVSDAANAVDNAVDRAIESIAETAGSIPSIRTVLLVGAGVAGLMVGAKIVRVFS